MSIDVEVRHITPANGNIFEDLGFAPAEAMKLKIKADLMIQLKQWIKESNLKQADAARPRVSNVMHDKVEKFTIDALVDMVELTGHHVQINIS
ncbi:MAG: XRE family transcriptional regulator [Thiotrichaceae bacterium]|nr:XRE family transcriptional regulator [Thiotrichaceae bacterium]